MFKKKGKKDTNTTDTRLKNDKSEQTGESIRTKFSNVKSDVKNEPDGKWYKPKKFFCKYPLPLGVKVVAILMIVVMSLCIIGILVNVGCIMTKYNTKDIIVINALTCTFTELAFSILMLIIHVLLLLSLKWKQVKKKTNVLVGWLATQAIWLIHKACFVLIAMLLLIQALNLGLWIFLAILAIIALALLFYFWMIVYSYWSSLKPQLNNVAAVKNRSKTRSSPRRGRSPRTTPKASPHRQTQLDDDLV